MYTARAKEAGYDLPDEFKQRRLSTQKTGERFYRSPVNLAA
jgi:hypothetical protein